MNTKDIEEIIEELKTLPIGVTVPFNHEMMWGEMIGLEADGWDKLETWLRDKLTTLTQHHKAEVERAYERGYKQGKFDKEMDDTYSPTKTDKQ